MKFKEAIDTIQDITHRINNQPSVAAPLVSAGVFCDRNGKESEIFILVTRPADDLPKGIQKDLRRHGYKVSEMIRTFKYPSRALDEIKRLEFLTKNGED